VTAPLAATTTTRHSPAPRPASPEEALAQAPLCAVCPKLCRPSCPVEQATGREALAPWRISATVLAAETSGWSPERAQVAASCTGCGACTDACLPGVVLPDLSRAARAAAVAAGVTVPAAVAMARRIAETGRPRRGADNVPALTGDGPTAVLFGCTVQAHSPDVGAALSELLAAAGAQVRGCGQPEGCCGAIALDLGLRDEAAQLARHLGASVAAATELVAVSPGCVRMIREEWPRLGAPTVAVRAAVEWLAAAISEGLLRPDVSGGTVAWHDPCTLARGLGVLTAPRAVLAALGLTVVEPRATGRDTRCSGAGAAYELVDPAGSVAVAQVRAQELAAFGATIVSACPQAERRLAATGAGPVRDLLEIAADRLVGAPGAPGAPAVPGRPG
jgi:Fe-S oxidoreductase